MGLLFAGATVLAGGLFVGERDLVALGVLLLALPLLSGLTLLGAFRGIGHGRALRPARAPVGSEAEVAVRIANTGALRPLGGVLAEDLLPPALGEPPRFRIGLLAPGRDRDLAYRVRVSARGLYQVGPVRVTLGDPLGCFRAVRDLGAPAVLMATPEVLPLGGGGSPAGAAEPGGSPARAMAASGEDDPVPRPYRSGDELRRVHWRSTARHGELMVRREEARHDGGAAVLVDLRAAAHTGSGPESTLETAVSAAASVAVHLSGQGRRVRLLTDGGEPGVPAAGPAGVVEALALAPASARSGLAAGAEPLRTAGSGPVVAVLGALGPADLEALSSAARGAAGPRTAVLCTDRPAGAEGAAAALTAAGWHVLVIGRPSDLPAAWGTPARGAPAPGGPR
ncbi:DUF58 domain-containing protein [Nocardiopsis potens]|uniref:DUF58 domain-containing protein n=1 Tax=Nocardiopsis potens TaxID=1246458 RepID=UPI00034BA26C|nr:DUF58 domain-containing protein [Nocardiopsis potens]